MKPYYLFGRFENGRCKRRAGSWALDLWLASRPSYEVGSFVYLRQKISLTRLDCIDNRFSLYTTHLTDIYAV